MQKKLTLDSVNLLVVDQWLTEEDIQLEEVGKSISSIFYVINPDLSFRYVNEAGHHWLNISQDEKSYRTHTIAEYFHSDTLDIALSQMKRFYELKNTCDLQYDLLKVWYTADDKYKLSLVTTKYSSNLDGFLVTIVPMDELPHLQERMGYAVAGNQ